jgi:transposase
MHTKNTKCSFKGQEIFVGMDVHKKDFTVTIIVGGMFYKTFPCSPNGTTVADYLASNFPEATYHSVYEAGFSGFWLHKELLKLGINSIVVNPADIPTTDKERKQKEDRRDSRKLAKELYAGQLQGIYVPDDRTLDNRSLLRAREGIVKEIRRCKQRIKSFLSFYGIRLPSEYAEPRKHWSRAFIKWIESITFTHETAHQALRIHIDSLTYHRNQLLQHTRQIRNLSRTEQYKGAMEKLISVPGFGILTSMFILTELVDITRFKRFDRLCSYVGFVPGTRSSGDRDKTTGITPRKNHRLRTVLIESAWTAIRCDPALMKAFLKYSIRMDKNKAIVRIAKKLLNRAIHTLRNNEKYKKGIAK